MIKYIEEAEKRGALAAKKYGAMSYSEILSRIIIWLLIGYIVIIFTCIGLYLSPVPDRMLSAVLLVFVLVEMATEYALWMFTYQGMKKTEAPLTDLQQFSTITKEGWRRAEQVLDWTAPFFAWADDLFKRSGLDWRQRGEKKAPTQGAPQQPLPPPSTSDVIASIQELTRAIEDVGLRVARMEAQRVPPSQPAVQWGTNHLKKE